METTRVYKDSIGYIMVYSSRSANGSPARRHAQSLGNLDPRAVPKAALMSDAKLQAQTQKPISIS